MNCHLGIDVGGTKIAAGLVDEQGHVSHSIRLETEQQSPASAVQQIAGLIQEYRGFSPAGIGIGVPGIANPVTGKVWAPNINGWDQIPLGRLLSETAEGCPITVESDRNTAVLAEVLFGSGQGKKDVIALIIGTGIGAGIFSGGRLVRGSGDIAGAVGWIPVSFRGMKCHFEEVAAGPAITSLGREAGLGETLPEIAREGRAKNSLALQIFSEVGTVIGEVLSILVSTLNPELVVMGGGVSRVWDLLEESATAAMKRWSQPISCEQVRVVPTELGDNAGIMGAAAASRESKTEG